MGVYTPFTAFGRLGLARSFCLLPILCSSSLLHFEPSRLAGAICRSLDHKDFRLGALIFSLIVSQ